MIFVTSDIAILNIKGSDYCYIISLIRKNEAINIMQNADLTEKVEHYKKVENYKLKKIYNFFLKAYIRMKKMIIKFGDNEIKIKKVHQHKESISKNI